MRILAILLVACAALVHARGVEARQMDPKQVAGIPLPVADVPVGTIVVRVIKGALSNNLPDQPVELRGTGSGQAGLARSATTDASGRAQFTGLAPGTRVTASATVAGEALQSQEIVVPSNGGIRVLLVATDPNAEKSAGTDRPAPQIGGAPAQAGDVVLGEQSRFVVEFGDGSLSVFNILQIVNASSTPVQPRRPLVFELPQQATGTTVLQESAPATITKGLVTVPGPFPPGPTLVQFAYSMPYSGSELTIAQPMPVPLSRVIVLAQKMGETRLESAQLSEQREMTAEGQNYIVAQGPAVGAGGALTLKFAGLPHHARWPRFVAIGIAVVILAAGAWASIRTAPAGTDKVRTRLETKRDHLFAELTALEEQHRAGRVDPERYASKRQELVAALERVYEEIDRRAA